MKLIKLICRLQTNPETVCLVQTVIENGYIAIEGNKPEYLAVSQFSNIDYKTANDILNKADGETPNGFAISNIINYLNSPIQGWGIELYL